MFELFLGLMLVAYGVKLIIGGFKKLSNKD